MTIRTFLPILCFAALGVALTQAQDQQQEAPVKKGGKKGGGKKTGAKKVEMPHPFYWAAPDEFRGDWQGSGYVAQVIPVMDKIYSRSDLIPQQIDVNHYEAHIYHQFDQPNDKPVAIMTGENAGDAISLAGDGWTGTISGGRFKAENGADSFDLHHIVRTSPTMGAKPPVRAVLLFDGSNMYAWSKMKEKEWLTEDGPPQWRLVPGGTMEVVPRSGSLISKLQFGDAKIHVEFRTLGGPTNSGVYIQDRYEANINEMYGRLDGNPCAQFDNSMPEDQHPGIRASRPPLEWQTMDIDFHAPKFDADRNKTADATVSLIFNGVTMYQDHKLGPVTLNAARLGEASAGPIQLQEHGMPVQFRNIWALAAPVKAVAAVNPPQKRGKQAGDDTSNPAYNDPGIALVPNTSSKPEPPAGFVHPGVLVNRAQLDEIKRRVAAGKEPQKSACDVLKGDSHASLSYTAHPRETVECGPRSNPDIGCKDEQNDSDAAYAQALMWSITGNPAYAENAIKIMNSWSSTLRGGHTNANAEVQASWAGAVWPRAAEIIRYTYPNWSAADIARFQNMLTMQYLPNLIHGTCENGNKEATMSEAIVGIGVFTDNRQVFNFGIKMWRGRAPALVYLKSDGSKPVEPIGCGPAIWGNKGFTPEFVEGLEQETARDSQHAAMAFSGMVDVAETARQQGIDLYAEQGERMVAAMKYLAQFLPPNNAKVPENLAFNLHPTWEIAYNEFHNRLGMALPKVAGVIAKNRPTGVNHHMAWETLTHGDIGGVGLPPVKN
jgi:hypothetical protein